MGEFENLNQNTANGQFQGANVGMEGNNQNNQQYNYATQNQGYGNQQGGYAYQNPYDDTKILEERDAASSAYHLSWFSLLGIIIPLVGWIVGGIVFSKVGKIITTDEIALHKKKSAKTIATIGFTLSWIVFFISVSLRLR